MIDALKGLGAEQSVIDEYEQRYTTQWSRSEMNFETACDEFNFGKDFLAKFFQYFLLNSKSQPFFLEGGGSTNFSLVDSHLRCMKLCLSILIPGKHKL